MNFNIEEIVKPLVEKNQKKIIRKEEIIKSLNDNMLEKNKLVLELEKLQDNKEQEIEDYVNFNLLDRDSNFYPGYASVIRKDLEREYNKEIEKLNQKITDADKKEEELNQKIKELDTFSNVDLYELTDIKEEVRKNLYKKRKELEYELSKENINFDSIMLEISSFKHQYNDKHEVTLESGETLRNLFAKSNESTEKIRNIKDALAEIDTYINMTQLTEEENKLLIRGLNFEEKAKYLERKKQNVELIIPKKIDHEDNVEVLDKEEVLDSEKVEDVETTEAIDKTEDYPVEHFDDIKKEKEEEIIDLNSYSKKSYISEEDIDKINDPVKANWEEITFTNDDKVNVPNITEAAKYIYETISDEIYKLDTIKLEGSKGSLGDNGAYISTKSNNEEEFTLVGNTNIESDNELGEHIHIKDLENALNKYMATEKGRTFKVKESKKEYNINKKGIKKFTESLKKCSALRLIRDKKLSKFDMLKFLGKEKTENLTEQVNIDTSNIKEGLYLNRNEVIMAIRNSLLQPQSKINRFFSKLGRTVVNGFNDEYNRRKAIFKEEDKSNKYRI